MFRLTGFELEKIWGNRRFQLSCLLLVLLELFLLWYTALPDEGEAGLSAYKAFQRQIQGMSEQEKADYVTGLKETMDGIGLVQEVLTMRGMGNEMGDAFAAQIMDSAPGVFEAYYELYQSEEYLIYTDSFWQERHLIEELYGEWKKCAGYGEYLQSVQETGDTLEGIGIFSGKSGGAEPSFSSRNVEKSARDYARLTDEKIRWMPGRALTGAMGNVWTDIFLLLSVFLAVGSLILEEKEKRLFYITRSTRYGMGKSIEAKLAALFIHCAGMAAILYGVNLLFFSVTVGYGDFGAALQSVAAYRESCLSVSIREFIWLSVLTKGLAAFGFGALLAALCIAAETVYLPFGAGILFCGISFSLYSAIPGASKWNLCKYLNPMGILKTEHYYGGYLNFNLFGYPVSQRILTWIVIIFLAAGGMVGSVFFYLGGEKLTLRDSRLPAVSLFRPHASLLRHECYKLMIVNRAALVLLAFGFLAGYREWGQNYYLSAQETYYQDMMLRLEGELTEEKEEWILSEHARYQDAFDQISQIEGMVSRGEISERAGEDLKAKYNAVTAFYPAFLRAWEQYQRLTENRINGLTEDNISGLAENSISKSTEDRTGDSVENSISGITEDNISGLAGEGTAVDSVEGNFVYDTGYLYLFGLKGEGTLIDLILLCCGIILAFGNAASMEDRIDAWSLLGSTRTGKRKVLLHKAVLCIVSAALLALVPFACRAVRIGRTYPFRGLSFRISDIPCYGLFASAHLLRSLPVWGFVLLAALSQAAVLGLAAFTVFALSAWRKEPLVTYFLAALLLLVPLALLLLGFPAADVFSLYPLYSWTARIGFVQ